MELPPISKNALREVIDAAQSPPVAMEMAADVIGASVSAPHLDDLLIKMESTEFTSPFDWQKEYGETPETLENVAVIRAADLDNLRKIMTAQIRIDRMSEGHLERLVENGYWQECIKRMAQLHAEMDDE